MIEAYGKYEVHSSDNGTYSVVNSDTGNVYAEGLNLKDARELAAEKANG